MIPKNKICTLIPFIPTFPPTPPRRQETTKYNTTESVQANLYGRARTVILR